MFFSEDLLSSKKGSFGIVWLAATLGPRTKRITRKQLVSVDLNRTCELIAQPPEPMALRLSGCLLVGVARVYHQNYDLFYSDVTKFHSDLRRMVVSEFGGQSGPNGQPAGLDLVGDGKARVDQITFGGEDISWLSGLDLELLKMDWDQPERASRKRRMSTQLSSLQSQQQLDKETDRDDDDSDENSEDEAESLLDAETREPKKKRMTSSPYGTRQVKGRRDRTSEDGGNFHDLLPDAPDLFPELSSQDESLPLGPPTSDPNDMVLPDFPAEPMIDLPPLEPTPRRVHEDAPAGSREGSKSREDEDVAGEAAPKKSKKPKRVKKLQYDDDLELERDIWRGRTYNDDMQRERSEQDAKDKAKGVEERANAFVDGAGLWLDFLDPEMDELFATCSKPDKFRWERDARKEDIASIIDGPPQDDEDQGQVQIQQDDPFLVNDFTNADTTYVEQHQDFSVPIQDVTGREGSQLPESEVGRRKSQPMPESQANLPWSAKSDDYEGLPSGDDFTPGTRLSAMTPLEKKIREEGIKGRNRRERSPSVPGVADQDPQPLVPDSQANDYPEDDPFATQNLPASQMRPELPHAYQPHMLATLEVQCRSFMTFTEKRMKQAGVDEIDFGDIVEEGAGKRIAALAFYNCLTLTTKSILTVRQTVPWESFTIRFTADLEA